MSQVPNFEALAVQAPQHLITDLVNEVTQAFSAAGHPNPKRWMEYLTVDAMETSDLSIQRFLINRAIRLVFAKYPSVNSMDIRFCLVDNGEIVDWLRLFKQSVVPCVMANEMLF